MRTCIILLLIAASFAHATSVVISSDTYTTYIDESASTNLGLYGTSTLGLTNQATLIFLDFENDVFTNRAEPFAGSFYVSDGAVVFASNGYAGSAGCANFATMEKTTVKATGGALGRMAAGNEFVIEYALQLTEHVFDAYGAGTGFGTFVFATSDWKTRTGFFETGLAAQLDRVNFEALNSSSGQNIIRQDAVLPTGEWVYIKNTVESDGTMRIFTNGAQAGSTTGYTASTTLLSLDTFIFNLSKKVPGYIDDFRITSVYHTNASNSAIPHEGTFTSTNVNEETNDIALLNIALENLTLPAEGVYEIYYSISGGSEWVRYETNRDGSFFNPANDTNFSSSNDLRVRVNLTTTDDRKAVYFESVGVNYFYASGANAPALNVQSITSPTLFTTSSFSTNFTIVLENSTPAVIRLFQSGSVTSALTATLFKDDGTYSNEVSNVSATNNTLYIPFPSIADANGIFHLALADTNITMTSQVVSNVVEVMSDMPIENDLLAPYENVLRATDTLELEFYSLYGDEGEYALTITTVAGRVIYATSGTITGSGRYTIRVPLNEHIARQSANGVYILTFRAGTRKQQDVIVIAQ